MTSDEREIFERASDGLKEHNACIELQKKLIPTIEGSPPRESTEPCVAWDVAEVYKTNWELLPLEKGRGMPIDRVFEV